VGKLPRLSAVDAPELAVERRRSSYSPLLLSPAIGQRAGELCEAYLSRYTHRVAIANSPKANPPMPMLPITTSRHVHVAAAA